MTTADEQTSDAIEATRLKRVVIGIDGSPNSVAALRFAVGMAGRDGAAVEVIYAFHPHLPSHYPYPGAVPPYGPLGDGTQLSPPVPSVLDARQEAERTIDSAMRDAFGRSTLPRVTLHAVEGSAHDVLARKAVGADLLVVGARGRGGPLGLLGSTAQASTRHATCPVLVVPAPADAR